MLFEFGVLLPVAVGAESHLAFLTLRGGFLSAFAVAALFVALIAALCGWAICRSMKAARHFLPTTALVYGPAMILCQSVALYLALKGTASAAVQATVTSLLCGRACVTMAVAFLLLGKLKRIRIVTPSSVTLGFVAVLITAFYVIALPWDSLPYTGDEPSYAAYADAILRDFSILPSPLGIVKFNNLFDMPASFAPHVVYMSNPPYPLHFLGATLLALPAQAAGSLLGLPIASQRFLMIVLFFLTSSFALRLAHTITGKSFASAISVAVLGLSLPAAAATFNFYPESFAALFVIAGLHLIARAVVMKIDLAPRNVILLALLICALPWLHPKFCGLSLGLAIGGLLATKARLQFVALLCLGAIIFLGINVPYYGSTLWNQAGTGSGRGILACLTDADNGLLLYMPYLVLLPVGVILLTRQSASRAITWVIVLTFGLHYLPIASSVIWNEGGSYSLRYFYPVVFLFAPFLASAFSRAPVTRLASVSPLVLVALGMAAEFIKFPHAAYSASQQQVRTVADTVSSVASLSELFCDYVYLNHGFMAGNERLHALLVLLTCAIIAAVLVRRSATKYIPVTIIAGICILIQLPHLLNRNSLQWNSVRVFARQCERMSFMVRVKPERISPGVKTLKETHGSYCSVKLDVGIPPMETYRGRYVKHDPYLRFGVKAVDGCLFGGPWIALPKGVYSVRLIGNQHGESPTSKTLSLVVNTTERNTAASKFRKEISTKTILLDPRTSGTLISDQFVVSENNSIVVADVFKSGAYYLTAESLEFGLLHKTTSR